MADAPGPITEVERRVQAIEGIEHSLSQVASNSTEQAAAFAKMQLELSQENGGNSGSAANKDLSKQVLKQLQADGFSNVAVDQSGSLTFNPADKVAGQKPSDSTASLSSTHLPQEADFIKFAQMLTQVPSGQKVDAKDFATAFGADDAAILQSMGLQSIANTNGHFETPFAKDGSIPCGSDTLEFQKATSFDFQSSSQGIELSNIKGLKGKEGALNPTVTKVSIAPEDPQSKQWKVDVTGKEHPY